MQAQTGIHPAAGSQLGGESGLEWAIRLIGVVQVLGGLFGAGRATALLIETHHPLNFLALAFYIFSVFAGILLCRGLLSGYVCSLALQIVQIPWILTSAIGYAFVSGAGLWLGAGREGFVRDSSMVSWFHFGNLTGWGIATGDASWHIGINLVALAVAAFLVSNWPKRKRFHA
jgi:hypothetical protein